MNDFDSTVDNATFAEKSKQIFAKIIKSVFDFKNLVRVFELILLLVFNVLYGKKPLFTW